MEDQLKLRRSIQSQMNTLRTCLNKHADHPINASGAKVHLNKVKALKRSLYEHMDSVTLLCDDDATYQVHEPVFADIEDKLAVAEILLTEIIETRGTPTPQPTPESGNNSSDLRLPRITLPKFNGDPNDWMQFRDLFTASVHQNPKATDAQKLTYLKSSLTGSASKLLSSMASTDANYSIAWSTLTERYQNERELVFAILNKFVSQPSMQGESATSLRTLIDVSKESMRSLEALNVPIQQWDVMLVFLIMQKLDNETKKAWELTLPDTSLPQVKEFCDYLELRARALATGTSSKTSHKTNDSNEQRKKGFAHHAAAAEGCKFCQKSHPLFRCFAFKKLCVQERREFARKNWLCFNCMRENHVAEKCSSNYTCKQCNEKHNTLLHPDAGESQAGSSSSAQIHHVKAFMGKKMCNDSLGPNPCHTLLGPNPCNTLLGTNPPSNYTHQIGNGILATALVKVLDATNNYQICRTFLDNGSTVSIMTESCARRLGLRRNKALMEMAGLASTNVGISRGTVAAQLFPHFSTGEDGLKITMLLLPTITGNLPLETIPKRSWTHLCGVQFADPQFHTPGKIDMLLGSDVFWDLVTEEKKKEYAGQLTGVPSRLGMLIVGNMGRHELPSMTHHVVSNIDEQLQKFWELENIPSTKILTAEEKKCEQHYISTTKRGSDGKYTVSFPFKYGNFSLGASREHAVRRLLSLERRLAGHPEHRKEYIDFMRQYIALGHMKVVESTPKNKVKPGRHNYIPHHFVLKESSTTTKFRVVFDASSKTVGGASLNDGLMIGPTIQDPLVSILTRFRTHIIAFTADIAKMYRQIRMNPDELDWQRILWRENPKEEMQEFQLLTVTYGTASAPFHATRTLQQLTMDEKEFFPLASVIARQDVYVDDLMSGSDKMTDALELQKQLIDMSNRGGFEFRKWQSNHEAMLKSLPTHLKETTLPLSLDKDNLVKTLGLYWNAGLDLFTFKVQLPPINPNVIMTKRSLLSHMSKTFDPLGWLSPITIRSKIMFQQMWKMKTGWDDPLPESIYQEWSSFRKNLPCIEDVKIKRCIKSGETVKFTLHGFSDASERAYSAVVYLKADSPRDPPMISLIAAKTRVAPAKTISIPRLELCGAVLLSNLMDSVFKSLKLNIDMIYSWTDSTIVLDWLANEPSRWKTFVANRVSEIHDGIKMSWGHVIGTENPADCASRGIDPSELVSHPLWWHGPDWLRGNKYPKMKVKTILLPEALEEEKNIAVVSIGVPSQDVSLLEKYSTLTRLKRVTAWCFRFLSKCRSAISRKKNMRIPEDTTDGELTAEELENSLRHWIRIAQSSEFNNEISNISSKLPLASTSKLIRLNPYLDDSHILRVGGRLCNAPLPENQKNPMVLPKKHKLTELIIRNAHYQNQHGGPQLVQAILQNKFWIIGAKDSIRTQIRRCVVCTRHQAKTMQQFMGNLPASRVTPSRPFLTCGVDYAGPFSLRAITGRSKVTFKSYLCLFVCFSTRAIHCEVVSSLTTDAFLAAFKRFVARRGLCKHVHSDCGTNFVGAAKELKEIYQLIHSDEHNTAVSTHLANSGIQWHFNPPGAPHFGGLWEAGVKSVKFHLHRVIGNARLTYEEFLTIITQIEACCNSRPMTPISTDPVDFSALTPAHFLIGDSLTSVPEIDISKEKENRLSRWQLTQQMTQHFWKRWSQEYLSRLQQRPKWLKHRTDVRVGDMVLIKDDNLPPLKWKLGRVTETHPGLDGLVRVVTVNTMDGLIKRPIVKICLLPIDNTLEENTDEDHL